MSSPADSFFNVFFTVTIFILFTGVLLVTFIAPMNIWPGSLIFPKYIEVCEIRCIIIVEKPINNLWGGLINGATYGVLGSIVVRSIWRKLKK